MTERPCSVCNGAGRIDAGWRYNVPFNGPAHCVRVDESTKECPGCGGTGGAKAPSEGSAARLSNEDALRLVLRSFRPWMVVGHFAHSMKPAVMCVCCQVVARADTPENERQHDAACRILEALRTLEASLYPLRVLNVVT